MFVFTSNVLCCVGLGLRLNSVLKTEMFVQATSNSFCVNTRTHTKHTAIHYYSSRFNVTTYPIHCDKMYTNG